MRRVLVLAFVVHRLAFVVLVDLRLGLLGLGLDELGPTVVEDRHSLLDAGQGPGDLGLERRQDLEGVLIGTGADLVARVLGLADDPPALLLGELQEAPLTDEERGLLLGPADDPGRLLVGLLDDPLALGVDPLRGTDLLRDRDAELVDEIEDRIPIDDDVPRQRQRPAGRDQGFEPLEEEDDVQERILRRDRVVARDYRTGRTIIGGPRAQRAGRRPRPAAPSPRRPRRTPRSP
jgi:hypothetical protein